MTAFGQIRLKKVTKWGENLTIGRFCTFQYMSDLRHQIADFRHPTSQIRH